VSLFDDAMLEEETDPTLLAKARATALCQRANTVVRDLGLIRKMARTGKPMILSTGMATLGEVEEARANVFLDKIRATLKSGEFKRQDQLIERLLEEGFSTTDIASALLHQLQNLPFQEVLL